MIGELEAVIFFNFHSSAEYIHWTQAMLFHKDLTTAH